MGARQRMASRVREYEFRPPPLLRKNGAPRLHALNRMGGIQQRKSAECYHRSVMLLPCMNSCK